MILVHSLVLYLSSHIQADSEQDWKYLLFSAKLSLMAAVDRPHFKFYKCFMDLNVVVFDYQFTISYLHVTSNK